MSVFELDTSDQVAIDEENGKERLLIAIRQLERKQSIQKWSIRFGFLIAWLGSWQYVSAKKLLNPVFIGEPSGIWKSFVGMLGGSIVTTDLKITLFESIIGFLASMVVGIFVAYSFVRFPVLERAFRPIVTAVNSVPRIALIPIFIIWFGFGPMSKIANIVSFVTFTVLLGAIGAFTASDRDHMLLAKVLGFSERERMWKFVVPNAIPALANIFELALIYSFLGAITAEMLGGAQGVGVRLVLFANQYQTNDYFAVLLLIVIVTVVIVQGMRLLLKRFVKWREVEMRGE